MRKPSERLQTVLKLASLRQQQAAEQLGAVTRQVQAQQHQQQQLRHYQVEYADHFKAQASSGISASQAQNFQRFNSNLEQAIDTQQERVVLSQAQLDQARQQWQQQYAREQNLRELIERKQRQEDYQLEKRQQRVQDDRQPRKPLR